MRNIIENIKELTKDKNGKSILFFGIYFVFFILLFLLLKFGGNDSFLTQEYEMGKKSQFSSSLLLNKNYYFDYKVTIDDNVYNYYGKRYQDNELFKYNNFDYYKTNTDFFVNNGTWIKCDNPYVYYELINVDNMSNIILNSTFMNMENIDDDKILYNYLVSSNTINKLIYNLDTDYDEVPNSIEVILDKKNGACNVKFKFDSLCKLNNTCSNSLIIDASFEMFNSVKEIDNPIK